MATVAALGPLPPLLLGAGCTTWPTPQAPMPVQRIAARTATRTRCVLLPGVASRAADFIDQGFVADLQAAAPACEVLLADAHLGYFVEGPLLPRLRADVVQPERGGPKPWLVGISLGGIAALAYAARHGDEIAGVLALAPYLGRRTLLRDITAAGGPEAWHTRPPQRGAPFETLEDDLWRWLAWRTADRARMVNPPVYLGYGRDDRFADAHRLLQSLLPASHTQEVPGGHDWPPWRRLWQQWLQQGLLASAAAGGLPMAAAGARALEADRNNARGGPYP